MRGEKSKRTQKAPETAKSGADSRILGQGHAHARQRTLCSSGSATHSKIRAQTSTWRRKNAPQRPQSWQAVRSRVSLASGPAARAHPGQLPGAQPAPEHQLRALVLLRGSPSGGCGPCAMLPRAAGWCACRRPGAGSAGTVRHAAGRGSCPGSSRPSFSGARSRGSPSRRGKRLKISSWEAPGSKRASASRGSPQPREGNRAGA